MKTTLSNLLSSGHKVTFEWDCGGDETLIDTFLDGKPARKDWVDPLCELVVEKLDLPNAGEWFVKGTGELFVKGTDLWIRHDSVGAGTNYEFPEDVDPSNLDYEEFEEYAVEVDDERIAGEEVLL